MIGQRVFNRGLMLSAAVCIAASLFCGPAAFGQSCELYFEDFPFGGPSDFDNGTFRVEWCTNGAAISGSQFCPTGSALRMNGTTQDPVIWVFTGAAGCTTARLEFDYSQFSATGTELKVAATSDTTFNCFESITASVGGLTTTGGVCTAVSHTVVLGGSQSVYWKFDHGSPGSNAIYIDNVRIFLETCDCSGGGGGDHDCCEAGGPGCNDPVIEACVCAQDSFCCDTEWDAQCVDEVESFGCGTCGSACATQFSADFGTFFQSGTVCENFSVLFESCEGAGPFTTSGTACGAVSDYAMSFATGFPHSAAITHCLDLSGVADANLQFNYTKSASGLGPDVDISLAGGAWQTIWSAPFTFPGGCLVECVDLNAYAGQADVRFRFRSGSSTSNGAAFDDILMTLGSPCGGGQHDCCETRPTGGCSDPTIQSCVCSIDPFCCDTQWDGQCVLAAEALGCTDCGGICLTGFSIDFGDTFVSGDICSIYPYLLVFESCEGDGPFLSSGSDCGGAGDEAMVLANGSPFSAAITRCIDFTTVTTAKLDFTYSKMDGTSGPIVEVSTDGGVGFLPLWTAPLSPGPGCLTQCLSLTPYAGMADVRLRFAADTTDPTGQAFDDVAVTPDESCSVCTAPLADAGSDAALCAGGTLVLNGSASGGSGGACPGDYTPSWDGPGVVSGGSTMSPTVNAAGTYTLSVSCDTCQDQDTVVVTETTFTAGDVNGDSSIDGHDIQTFVNVLLGAAAEPAHLCAADVDGLNGPTVEDLDEFVSLLLSSP